MLQQTDQVIGATTQITLVKLVHDVICRYQQIIRSIHTPARLLIKQRISETPQPLLLALLDKKRFGRQYFKSEFSRVDVDVGDAVVDRDATDCHAFDIDKTIVGHFGLGHIFEQRPNHFTFPVLPGLGILMAVIAAGVEIVMHCVNIVDEAIDGGRDAQLVQQEVVDESSEFLVDFVEEVHHVVDGLLLFSTLVFFTDLSSCLTIQLQFCGHVLEATERLGGQVTEIFDRHHRLGYDSHSAISTHRTRLGLMGDLTDTVDGYSDYLDKALDTFISSDFITPEIAGAVGENIDVIKNALKAYFLRAWMAKNGFFSELGDIVSLGENDKPTIELSDIMTTHIEGVNRTALNFISRMKPIKEATDTDIANLNVEASDVSSSSSSDEDTPDDGGGDDMGMGDMDFGLDDGGADNPDETPSEEEAPTE